MTIWFFGNYGKHEQKSIKTSVVHDWIEVPIIYFLFLKKAKQHMTIWFFGYYGKHEQKSAKTSVVHDWIEVPIIYFLF